jgi:hypothetical protein
MPILKTLLTKRLASGYLRKHLFGRVEWIIERASCNFGRFELEGVQTHLRHQALNLQLQQWHPHQNTGQCVVWQGGSALVWSWDADCLLDEIQAERLRPEQINFIPETLFYPPHTEGARLLVCQRGFEGQIWQTGRLAASRWWREPPGDQEWLNFQRDLGVQPELQQPNAPKPLELTQIDRPWAKSVPLESEGHPESRFEGWLVAVSALLLASYTSWHGIRLYKAEEAMLQRTDELQLARAAARPLQSARQQAMDAQARIHSLQAVNPYPDQLALLARVAGQLSRDGSYLKEWEYSFGSLIFTITVQSKSASSQLVTKFQESGWFRDVRTRPAHSPDDLILAMSVLPTAEIKEDAFKDPPPLSVPLVRESPVIAPSVPRKGTTANPFEQL